MGQAFCRPVAVARCPHNIRDHLDAGKHRDLTWMGPCGFLMSLIPAHSSPQTYPSVGNFGKLSQVPGQAPSRVSEHSPERETHGSRSGQLALPEEPNAVNSCFDHGPWELFLCWLNRQEVNMRRGDQLRLPVHRVSL